jgi:hypothetical protein
MPGISAADKQRDWRALAALLRQDAGRTTTIELAAKLRAAAVELEQLADGSDAV